MTKRGATSHRLPRKKRKGGVSYAAVDIDSLDQRPPGEDIRVWNVTRSETTGRVSATRRNHQHFLTKPSAPLPSHEEQAPTDVMESFGVPVNPEVDERPSVRPVAKHQKRKATKENDSVSSIPKA